MKLTWFGGTTLRIHVGGRILVCDADGAPERIDRAELLSGADRAFALDDDLPVIDPQRWAPRKVAALIDETADLPEMLVHRAGENAVLIEAVGEPPLLLATGEIEAMGRWVREAVVVIAGRDLPRTARSILDECGPRLIAVAGPESAMDAVIAEIGNRLDGTGLLSLEPGLALEV
jgi:hypothetical protein